ncbi:MAG: GYD domain-containing protein, partial [bacterium]
KCPEVTFVSHYALLGEYDFIDIYEAPDEETAAKVSIISLQNGAFQAKSMLAIPYKRYLNLIKEIT